MAPGDEPCGGVVLDGPALAVRTDDAELAHLLAGLEEVQPGRVEVEARLVEEVVEPLAEQILQRQPEQAAGGRIGVDESPRVVDDEHGVPGGREKSLGRVAAGHRNSIAVLRRALGGLHRGFSLLVFLRSRPIFRLTRFAGRHHQLSRTHR